MHRDHSVRERLPIPSYQESLERGSSVQKELSRVSRLNGSCIEALKVFAPGYQALRAGVSLLNSLQQGITNRAGAD